MSGCRSLAFPPSEPSEALFGGRARGSRSGEEGFSLLEILVSMTIVAAILLGVMALVSNASIVERDSSENLASQLLLNQVIEEMQSNMFSNLLSFNGQYVLSGNHRADITVALVSTDLARLQIVVTSPVFTGITNRAVLLLANTD